MTDFSTETAYPLVLAQVIVWRLEMATGLYDDRRSAVQIWLHGGIANALLHDNLEIGSLRTRLLSIKSLSFSKKLKTVCRSMNA